MTAIDKMHLMVVIFTIGEKLSLKSTRSLWISPITTSLAFNHSRLSSYLCFILNTHLQGEYIFPLSWLNYLQVLLSLQGFKFTCHSLLPPKVHSNLCIRRWFSHKRNKIKNFLINLKKVLKKGTRRSDKRGKTS